MKGYHEISAAELENVCNLFDRDWTLITVKDGEGANAMTASWGGVGILWNKSVAFLFVRPQRHTHTLLEREERFSLCFLPEAYRDALRICGTKSGRDGDKLAAAGLTVNYENSIPFVGESRLVVLCRKCYADDLKKEGFLDGALLSNYASGDFHRMYIAEIEYIYERD